MNAFWIFIYWIALFGYADSSKFTLVEKSAEGLREICK